MNNKKSYVYKITCLVTGEFYFGSSFRAKRDSYLGGGKRIRERISQYGKENFIKEILGEFDDRVEANKKENQYIEKFRNDEKCLNQRLEHQFGSYGEESRAKNSAAKRGKKVHGTENTSLKNTDQNFLLLIVEKSPMCGKHCTDEFRSKISAAFHGKHWRKNPVTGKREWYD